MKGVFGRMRKMLLLSNKNNFVFLNNSTIPGQSLHQQDWTEPLFHPALTKDHILKIDIKMLRGRSSWGTNPTEQIRECILSLKWMMKKMIKDETVSCRRTLSVKNLQQFSLLSSSPEARTCVLTPNSMSSISSSLKSSGISPGGKEQNHKSQTDKIQQILYYSFR